MEKLIFLLLRRIADEPSFACLQLIRTRAGTRQREEDSDKSLYFADLTLPRTAHSYCRRHN